MFAEEYAALPMSEQERFRHIINILLGRTFLLAQEFDFSAGIRQNSRDYRFVEANYGMFEEYLAYAGFSLHRDAGYGLIWISSEYDTNRVRLDKFTTQVLYTLRLIYEEQREELSLSREAFVSVGELVSKMMTFQVITKKPSGLALSNALRTLRRFRIVDKDEGGWDEATTQFLLLPTVLFAVSVDQINHMAAVVDAEDGEESGKEVPDEEADEADDDSLVQL